MQADEVRIGKLIPEMTRLLRKFLGKFVKISIIKDCSSDMTKVDLSVANQLDDEFIAIGMKARALLADESLDVADESKFFRYLKTLRW